MADAADSASFLSEETFGANSATEFQIRIASFSGHSRRFRVNDEHLVILVGPGNDEWIIYIK